MKIVAAYLRLSIEDEEYVESNSIINQRLLIQKYLCGNPEFSDYEIREYHDDGYSGTSFKRPGVTSLLNDIKRNFVTCIIVKDFSRFSRDYIDMGSYLNQIFPFMGVRFISILDCYDSKEHRGNTLEIDDAFKTLLNDLYCKDISAKVKAGLNHKYSNGEYAFGQAPFGYEKISDQKNQIRVSEKEAEIVRFIFELSANGLSPVEIEKKLHKERVPTCSQIRGKKKKNKEHDWCWCSSMVRKILTNRFYLGEFAYHKSEVVTVGSNKVRQLPKEQWKTIVNHHKPLVSIELFERAQYYKTGISTKRKHPKHPFTGKLYCGGCGYAMIYKRSAKGKEYRRFECRKHAQLRIESCCTYYRAEILEELVLTMLNKELIKMADLQQCKKNLIISLKNKITQLNEKLREEIRNKDELEQDMSKAYEEYADGVSDAEQYKSKARKIELLMNKLEYSITQYNKYLSVTKTKYFDNLDGLSEVLTFVCISELTQEVVDEFINHIKVFKDKSIEIEWGFNENNIKEEKVVL